MTRLEAHLSTPGAAWIGVKRAQADPARATARVEHREQGAGCLERADADYEFATSNGYLRDPARPSPYLYVCAWSVGFHVDF